MSTALTLARTGHDRHCSLDRAHLDQDLNPTRVGQVHKAALGKDLFANSQGDPAKSGFCRIALLEVCDFCNLPHFESFIPASGNLMARDQLPAKLYVTHQAK